MSTDFETTEPDSQDDDRKLALKKSLDLLSRREHSAREIQYKLHDRGYEDTVIDSVLDYLFEKNYLNDLRFAKMFVRMRADKGFGERDIRAKLAERGICKSDTQLALSDFETDWTERATVVLEKKFRHSAAVMSERQWRERGARFLQSRGFDATHTFSALDNYQIDKTEID